MAGGRLGGVEGGQPEESLEKKKKKGRIVWEGGEEMVGACKYSCLQINAGYIVIARI